MGQKEWLDEFSSQNRIRVHFVTDRGRVTQIILIQYEALIRDHWQPVVRYDTAHGFFHRDLLYPGGGQEKMAIPSDNLARVLTAAFADIKQNWADYRQQFEEKFDDVDQE